MIDRYHRNLKKFLGHYWWHQFSYIKSNLMISKTDPCLLSGWNLSQKLTLSQAMKSLMLLTPSYYRTANTSSPKSINKICKIDHATPLKRLVLKCKNWATEYVKTFLSTIFTWTEAVLRRRKKTVGEKLFRCWPKHNSQVGVSTRRWLFTASGWDYIWLLFRWFKIKNITKVSRKRFCKNIFCQEFG